jgi:hypothetical protein
LDGFERGGGERPTDKPAELFTLIYSRLFFQDVRRFYRCSFCGMCHKYSFMAKLKGRPPKAKKQEVFLGFFVTRAQHFVIRQKVEKADVTFSDYMRQMAVTGFVKAKWTAEEREMVRKLVNISVDINRLAEMAKKQDAAQAMLFFVRYRDIMDSIIKALRNDR